MKKIDTLRILLKELLKDGPVPASVCLVKADQITRSKKSLDKVKQENNIKSYEAFNGIWWWYDPNLKMTKDQKEHWYERYKEFLNEKTEDYLELKVAQENHLIVKSNGAGVSVTTPIYDNPYEWLEDNSIYYFDDYKTELREERQENNKHKNYYKKYYREGY